MRGGAPSRAESSDVQASACVDVAVREGDNVDDMDVPHADMSCGGGDSASEGVEGVSGGVGGVSYPSGCTSRAGFAEPDMLLVIGASREYEG